MNVIKQLLGEEDIRPEISDSDIGKRDLSSFTTHDLSGACRKLCARADSHKIAEPEFKRLYGIISQELTRRINSGTEAESRKRRLSGS